MSFNEPDEFFLKAMKPYEITKTNIRIDVYDSHTMNKIGSITNGDILIRTGKPYAGVKFGDGSRSVRIPVMLVNRFLVGYIVVSAELLNDARFTTSYFKELTEENIGDSGQPNKIFEKVKKQLQERTVTCEYEDKEEVQPVVSNPEQKP